MRYTAPSCRSRMLVLSGRLTNSKSTLSAMGKERSRCRVSVSRFGSNKSPDSNSTLRSRMRMSRSGGVRHKTPFSRRGVSPEVFSGQLTVTSAMRLILWGRTIPAAREGKRRTDMSANPVDRLPVVSRSTVMCSARNPYQPAPCNMDATSLRVRSMASRSIHLPSQAFHSSCTRDIAASESPLPWSSTTT